MGEEPPPPPPGPPILLFLLSLPGNGAPGDGGKENKVVFTDTERVYSWRIPGNSVPHRLTGAAYGEYEFWPLQRWPHSLKHGGVASLHHPRTHPVLRRQLGRLLHILVPRGGLTREQPLASVARTAALHEANVDPDHALASLKGRAGRPGPAQIQKGGCHRRRLQRVGGRDVCPTPWAQVLQKLFRRRNGDRKRQVPGRQRRALPWVGQVLYPRRAVDGTPLPPAVNSSRDERKDIPKPEDLRGAQLNPTPPSRLRPSLPNQPSLPSQPSLPIRPTEAGEAQKTRCQCLDRGLGKAQDPPGEGVKGQQQQQQAGVRVPTPRTEEAAWAASALTFLLVVLTLAVLYTRLHRKFRRSRSLYWTASGEEGHDTVAAVVKHRLLSVPERRKKRPRRPQQQQQRPLLPTSSSDSSE